jgi:hypothetical protein
MGTNSAIYRSADIREEFLVVLDDVFCFHRLVCYFLDERFSENSAVFSVIRHISVDTIYGVILYFIFGSAIRGR